MILRRVDGTIIMYISEVVKVYTASVQWDMRYLSINFSFSMMEMMLLLHAETSTEI